MRYLAFISDLFGYLAAIMLSAALIVFCVNFIASEKKHTVDNFKKFFMVKNSKPKHAEAQAS